MGFFLHVAGAAGNNERIFVMNRNTSTRKIREL